MPLIQVKQKGQVTIPNQVRQKAGLHIGDLLDVQIERGKITLTPQRLVDKRIAESLEQFRQGKGSPIFTSADAAIKFLHQQTKQGDKKSKRT